MNFNFKIADKQQLQELFLILFDILYQNMGEEYLGGNSYEENYNSWICEVRPAMEKSARQIILMYCNNALAGFFQYYVNSETFMMEEMQIKKEFQGSGIFSRLYSWLLPRLPQNTPFVEAYTHKGNTHSQAILNHLGLTMCNDENEKFSHFKGEFKNLLSKYTNK